MNRTGKTAEDLRARERRVEVEADGGVRQSIAKQARDQHQVVVVDPNYRYGKINRSSESALVSSGV